MHIHLLTSTPGSPKSYIQASVLFFPFSDRYLGKPITGHIVEQRLNQVDYIALENIDPASTEEEVHILLLQAIQGAPSAGYQCLFPLYTPELTTPPLLS